MPASNSRSKTGYQQEVHSRWLKACVFLVLSVLALVPVDGGAAQLFVAQWFNALHYLAGAAVFLLNRRLLPATELNNVSRPLAFIVSLIVLITVEAAQFMTGRSVDEQDVYRGGGGAVVAWLVSSFTATGSGRRFAIGLWRVAFVLLALPTLVATVDIGLFFRMVFAHPEMCDFEFFLDHRLWSMVHGPKSARPRVEVVNDGSQNYDNQLLQIFVRPPGWSGVSVAIPTQALPDAREMVVSVDAYSFDHPFDLHVRCSYQPIRVIPGEGKATFDKTFRLDQPTTRLTVCDVTEPGTSHGRSVRLLSDVMFFGFGVQTPNSFGLDNLRFSRRGAGDNEQN
jgi:hypothetical protein